MEATRAQPSDAAHLAPAQRQRLEKYQINQCVDIHCHCLPCLDDGPETLTAAMELCRALADDGITAVVATPHQLGRYYGKNSPSAVRESVAALNRALLVEGVPLQVFPGADVRIDEGIERLLREDGILTVADRHTYLLLELPHDTYIDPLPLMRRLAAAGITPIVTHPERSTFITGAPSGGIVLLRKWVESGAVLQVTAGSVVGDFGATPQRAALYWLEAGLVGLVASDAHGAKRPPRMTAAIDALNTRFGVSLTRRVCIDNPARVLESSPTLGPIARSNQDTSLTDLDL